MLPIPISSSISTEDGPLRALWLIIRLETTYDEVIKEGLGVSYAELVSCLAHRVYRMCHANRRTPVRSKIRDASIANRETDSTSIKVLLAL